MANLNRLDAVWASMTAADRIVLLGHDRDDLDEKDKARLAVLIAASTNRVANRPAQARRSTRRGRRNRVPA